MAVIQMTERPGTKRARVLKSSRALGVDVAQTTFGEAYARVLRDYPGAKTATERYDLALKISFDSLAEAMRRLDGDIPCISDLKEA